MQLGKLITLTFPRNVAGWDRALRALLALGLGAVALRAPLPSWASIAVGLFSGMVGLTAVLSKCSIYYLLGYSTCPLDDRPRTAKAL